MASTVLRIRVKPGSRISELMRSGDGTWLARLRAPPIDGQANQELLTLVAREFGVRKADVTMAAGANGRIKRVLVET